MIKLEKGHNETVEKMRGKKGKDLDVAFRWETAEVVVDSGTTATATAEAPGNVATNVVSAPAPATNRIDEVLELLESEPEDAEFHQEEEVEEDMVDEYDDVV